MRFYIDLGKSSEGEGSRGGHVIGHTKSGEPIYESSRKGFSAWEKKVFGHIKSHRYKVGDSFSAEMNDAGGRAFIKACNRLVKKGYLELTSNRTETDVHQESAHFGRTGGGRTHSSLILRYKILKDVGMDKSEKLVGGLADGKPDSEFPEDKLKQGVKVESEHTDDKQQAKEIAKDHLKEDPQYYVKLDKIEKSGLGKPHKYIRKYRKGASWIYVYHEGQNHKMLSEDGVSHLHTLYGLGHEQTKHMLDNAEEVDTSKLKYIKELADLGHEPAQKMLAEHNPDAVKALFEEKKDPKKFDNWVMPNEEQTKQEYEWEYKKHPDLFGYEDVFPTLGSWEDALNNAKIETLTDAADKKIGRRTFVSSLAELKGIVGNYKHPRDVGKIEQGFNEHAAMPLPIVIERADGSRFVLGGNTRLSAASVMGVTKKALIVKIPEKGIKEMKAEVKAASGLGSLAGSKVPKIKALAQALNYWTGSGYTEIRPIQQGKKTGDEYAQKHLKALDDAFDLLPGYDGPIKRITLQTQEKIDKLYKGDNKVFTMDAYSSFAKMTGNYDKGPGGIKLHVKILVKKNISGKLIHMISNHTNEHEVLVAKGTKYRVLEFKQNGKYVEVKVEEVLDKSWVEATEEENALWNDQFDEPMGDRGGEQ